MRLGLNEKIAVVLPLVLAGAVSAEPVLPTLWTPGDAGSTAQAWDIFQSTTASTPDVLNLNPNGTATAYDDNAPGNGAFITSGGNIYSFSGVVAPSADIPHYGSAGGNFTTVLVNFTTYGEVTNITTATLTDGTTTFDYTNAVLTDEDTTNLGQGGYEQDFWVQFNVPGSAASYTFHAEASGSSLSLNEFRVDTFTSADPTIEPPAKPFRQPGDANGDGTVDLSDFVILRNNFGGETAAFSLGDFNSDGEIDLGDFVILRNNFGNSAGLPDLDRWRSTVPEPAALGTGLLLSGLLLRRRR